MSNKQNDILIDNLIDRAEELGIYELLIENPQGFRMTDPEEIESYLNYFESLQPNKEDTRYFWCIGQLKAKVRADRWAKQMRIAYPDFTNAIQHAYYLAGLTDTDGVIDTCTEYGEVKPEENKKESIIL